LLEQDIVQNHLSLGIDVQVVEGDTVPRVCPAGHSIDDPELTGDGGLPPVETQATVEVEA
jgi:hypothetical protein